MRSSPRLIRSVLFLCLPTLVVVGLAFRFAWVDVPRIVVAEQERVKKVCEGLSDELLKEPEQADFVWRRGEGVVSGADGYRELFPAELTWKDWPSKGRAKTKRKWGFFTRPDGCLVWVRDTTTGGDPDVIFGRQTDVKERDYARLIYLFGGFSLFVLVGITFVGVRYFVDYVKARDDFMAATAHDLTTPLVGMRLLIGRDDAAARTLNERLIRLVENVKDFMRLGGTRKPPVCAPFDIAKTYREAYTLFREDYQDAFDGADVPVETPAAAEDGAVMVQGDETLTLQILWNLLGNDLKYAAPYGCVKVVFRREGGKICVDFVDEGPGMTRRQRARAFDRYYRAKTVLESGKGGFGIGLCTAREFAEAMGGRLTVRANKPKGCVFTLTLPASS